MRSATMASGDHVPLSPAKTGSAATARNTVALLQQRLEAAEQDTRQINETLEHMGVPCKDAQVRPVHLAQNPFIAPGPQHEQNVFAKNYEILVSRTCRLESTIQSLKLNLCTLQAEKEITKKVGSNSNQKLVMALEAYDREMLKNKRGLEDLRFEKKNLEEDLQSARVSLEEKRRELVEANQAKDSAVAVCDDAVASKQKLMRRVGELKQELERETSLRAALEESQSALLRRVNEMETMVETEREQVFSLSSGSTAVKKELMMLQEELKVETALRQQSEELIRRQQAELEKKSTTIRRLEEEKHLLMTETGKVKALYKDLNEQLSNMQNVFEEKQDLFRKLDTDNRQLEKSLAEVTLENKELITKYENRLEEEKATVRREFDAQDEVIKLRERLRKESKDRDAMDSQCDQWKSRHSELQNEFRSHKIQCEQQIRVLTEQLSLSTERVKELEEEKEQTLLDKDNLLNEVNAAMDEMTQQRASMGCELDQARVEIDVLQRSKTQLEEENSRLQSRVETLHIQQTSHQHVDDALKEMLQQKNKLAYDKGRLQCKVDQLQTELESMTKSQAEILQLRKQNQTLEAKYTKSQTDLQAAKITINQYDAQLVQFRAEDARKERDFVLAIESRDLAVKEADKLLGHIEAVEDRERGKVAALQQSLCDSRNENKKMAATLETVIHSHSQLQLSIEQLQLQLGRRDAEILQLTQDRDQSQVLLNQVKSQLTEAAERLSHLESYESKEVEPLRKTLELSRTDNVKLTNNVATLMDKNHEMETRIKSLEDDIEQKSFFLEQQRVARKSDQEEAEKQLKNYDDRIKNLKQELQRERAKTLAKNNKEINEYKRLHEDLTTKNGELSRANAELRKKLMDTDDSVKDLKTKVGSQKAQLEQLVKTRKNQEGQIENLKKILPQKSNDRLRELETTKEKYAKKVQSQAQTIKTFTSQVTSLQEQIRRFNECQEKTQQTIRQHRSEMEKLAKQNAEMAQMFEMEKKKKADLVELSRQMCAKLQDAQAVEEPVKLESTDDVTEAERDVWVRKQVEELQHELEVSRRLQERFAEEAVEQHRTLEEEKRKAREIAQQAEEMLKINRENMARVALAAEMNREEAKHDLQGVYQQLAKAREESRKKDEKIRRLKKSSLRQMEDLARSLTPDNSRQAPRTSSPFYVQSD